MPNNRCIYIDDTTFDLLRDLAFKRRQPMGKVATELLYVELYRQFEEERAEEALAQARRDEIERRLAARDAAKEAAAAQQ